MPESESPEPGAVPEGAVPDGGEPADPVLAEAVREIEAHAADSGWDQQARLYALVPTRELVVKEPALAEAMGLQAAGSGDSLTPVEQELRAEAHLESVLESIMWPASVAGCAAIVERNVLPPSVDGPIPEDPTAAQEFAAAHPDRQEVRIVAGVTRAGSTYCALRLRSHDDEKSVVGGADLVPGLLELLRATLEGDGTEEKNTP